MESLHRAPATDSRRAEALAARLGRLVRLELELGLAETRTFVQGIAVAIVVAVSAAIALIAAFVVLLAAALSPVFGALGAAADRRGWRRAAERGGPGLERLAAHPSVVAYRDADFFEENWRWLAAQLRSRLTLHSRAA